MCTLRCYTQYVRPQIWEIQFFWKLNYGTPQMTIYGAQVNRKWTRSESEVECLCPAIFNWITKNLQKIMDSIPNWPFPSFLRNKIFIIYVCIPYLWMSPNNCFKVYSVLNMKLSFLFGSYIKKYWNKWWDQNHKNHWQNHSMWLKTLVSTFEICLQLETFLNILFSILFIVHFSCFFRFY